MPRVGADGQIGGCVEAGVAGAVDEASLEGDLRVALDAEEVRAAQVLVAVLLARPETGRVDLAAERRVERLGEVEVQLTVDGSLNRPLTQVTIMCRARNWASVWPGSKIQVGMAGTLLR
jgi:hypothetical protein